MNRTLAAAALPSVIGLPRDASVSATQYSHDPLGDPHKPDDQYPPTERISAREDPCRFRPKPKMGTLGAVLYQFGSELPAYPPV